MKMGRFHITHDVRSVILVVVIFGFTRQMLGCASGTVHVVSADAAPFQELLRSEMVTDARRPAHLLRFSMRRGSSHKAGVSDDARLREPNAVTIGPSVPPGEYHLAYAAQRLSREQYAATHPGIERSSTTSLRKSSIMPA